MEVGLDPGRIVLDGDSAHSPSKKRGDTAAPQFSAHVCCGQTAGWIKVPLGREVNLGPGDVDHGRGHIVLVGDPAPAVERGTEAPRLFGPCLL